MKAVAASPYWRMGVNRNKTTKAAWDAFVVEQYMKLPKEYFQKLGSRESMMGRMWDCYMSGGARIKR